MKISYALALALSAAAVPAFAQPAATAPAAAPAVEKGAMIYTADGRRIGRVDRVRTDAVSIIYNGKMVYIPVSTISAGDHGYTTSLSKAELGKL